MTTDRQAILAALTDAARERIEALECFATLDSTSTRLINEAAPAPGRCRIAIADEQTAGRGRRDNRWLSPKGAGLWLSLSYTFEEAPQGLPGITLAIGAGIAEALDALGANVQLKWPNDLVANDGKLGGILAETKGQRQRTVVVGVGLNVELPAALKREVGEGRDTPVTDLAECVAELPPRATLAACVIDGLVESLQRFETEGLAAGLDCWRRRDWLAGKRIAVEEGGRRLTGTAAGIDADGALLLQTNAGMQRVVSGTVGLNGPAQACA